MSTVTMTPRKRVLGDCTKSYRNGNVLPPSSSAKKRKLNTGFKSTDLSGQAAVHGKFGSSQPKSQFEEEVLEKLTQDISGLKKKNSEKDQQWDRPGLEDFDAKNDTLCFQQIDAEEGTLHGGRTAVKLFGVTEASYGSSDRRDPY